MEKIAGERREEKDICGHCSSNTGATNGFVWGFFWNSEGRLTIHLKIVLDWKCHKFNACEIFDRKWKILFNCAFFRLVSWQSITGDVKRIASSGHGDEIYYGLNIFRYSPWRICHHINEYDHIFALSEELHRFHGSHHVYERICCTQKHIDPCPIHCILNHLCRRHCKLIDLIIE